jgi:bifunctional DNA-binding transcriptional regulator/antitoxin component of YhaV-PrlF toxin-antitoxin module
MFSITMSTRGQFVLPKDIRERLKLLPGCRVEGSIDAQGRLVLVPALHEPEELFRDRPLVTRTASIRQMNEAIGEGVRRRAGV